MDIIRKRLHELFKNEGLKIIVELHGDSVNYLDTELNLKYRSYKPYKKKTILHYILTKSPTTLVTSSKTSQK